jgi:hypothetical protein
MSRFHPFPLFVAAVLSLFLAAPAVANSWPTIESKNALTAFASEDELNQWLLEKKKQSLLLEDANKNKSMEMSSPAPAPAQAEESAGESITNTQTAGVDEGGIVKLHGDFLVILRRGRLFTVDLRNERMEPVSVVDAYAPGSSGQAWYDEMLISGNKVIVIGYSYSKRGMEVVLFNIDPDGRLFYAATYVLRANDYYSSRNYASRLIGDKLIFYAPLFLNFYRDPLGSFPAMYRWESGKPAAFERLAPATKIYRAEEEIDPRPPIVLHTVQICDLSRPGMACTATGVLGPTGREFYVSRDAVFVWTVPYGASGSTAPVNSSVFRLPFDGEDPPTALKTLGGPIDQFSFLESGGYLNVLLRAEGPSASMWASEIGSQNLALLRVSVSQFGDGSGFAPLDNYHPLPSPVNAFSLQNRYIGDYLVYGAGNTWRGNHRIRSVSPVDSAYLLNWKNPENASISLPVAHTVDRIEALGDNPLLVGSGGGDLHFTTLSVSLAGNMFLVRMAGNFRLPGASQGETRSHGFFYKPDDKNTGILGLPFRNGNAGGWRQLEKASNGIIYLRNLNLNLSELGSLNASPMTRNPDDNCKASCVDWYGNSRPLFLKGRIFALMGYELVEGRVTGARISEVQRIDFSPGKIVMPIRPLAH